MNAVRKIAFSLAEKILSRESEIYAKRTAGERQFSNLRPRIIDLFCGAGGLTAGFTNWMGHSFQVVWANDNDSASASTYTFNFGDHCTNADIMDAMEDSRFQVPEADVVVGGPPCQGFSLLNRNRDGDPRKHMWKPFLEVVRRSGARAFVMENVPQLLGSPEYGAIVERAGVLGFNTASAKLCCADYGVPQTRNRAIIVGCRDVDPAPLMPIRKTHYSIHKGAANIPPSLFDGEYIGDPKPWRTVRDAISDLPCPTGTSIRNAQPPLDLHFGRNPTATSMARYQAISQQGMNRFDLQRIVPELTPECWIRKTSGGTDLFGRLWWDRPSFTIRTEFFKPEKGRYLHPEQHRPITHREAARLQSFPDSFHFCGSKISIARQIGNAVPPLLAARLADLILSIMETTEGFPNV
jgi:DNA (cytosine-5)-methyltransferase 1